MRNLLYALARLLGDLNAISRGPEAIARRVVRKSLYRTLFGWINRLFR
jgi:hypothetical protein